MRISLEESGVWGSFVDNLDLNWLLRARLLIGRFGETDVFGWWRTDGVLGQDGAFVGPRVVPKTHATARARIVFAVARHACLERYPDTGTFNLFSLDPVTEDRFDALLVDKLADTDFWLPAMAQTEAIGSEAVIVETLLDAEVISADEIQAVAQLSLGPAGRSVAVTADVDLARTLRLMAAAFSHSKRNSLAVPHVPKKVFDR